MEGLIIVIHTIACIGLILIVLLQAGKGMSISSIFGGGSESIFGGGGGNVFLKKVTVTFAIVFMLTSLTLTVIRTRQPIRSVMTTVPAQPPAPSPPPQPQQPAGQ